LTKCLRGPDLNRGPYLDTPGLKKSLQMSIYCGSGVSLQSINFLEIAKISSLKYGNCANNFVLSVILSGNISKLLWRLRLCQTST